MTKILEHLEITFLPIFGHVLNRASTSRSLAMEPAAVTRSKSAPSRTTSTATKPPAMPDKVCPICCTATAKLVASAPACACHACHACVERWVAMQLPACRAKKQLRVKCFGCAKMMSQRTVLENSAAAAELACQLEPGCNSSFALCCERCWLASVAQHPVPIQVVGCCPRSRTM